MMILAFSRKTSQILPRILCRRFRHVAPIICGRRGMVMLHFVRPGEIYKIRITLRDIQILRRYGWEFIYIPNRHARYNAARLVRARSCVDLTKRACKIRAPFVQTPYSLYCLLLRSRKFACVKK